MAKKERIVRYSAEELQAMRERGESQSDWVRAAAMTDAEIEAAIAADPDEAGMTVDWAKASIDTPRAKAVLNMRVDRDVLEFFRRDGPRLTDQDQRRFALLCRPDSPSG